MPISAIIFGILANVCPKCEDGKIFKNLVQINHKCASCGFPFEREQGYFTGAMIFSYIIGFFAILPTVLIQMYYDTSFVWMLIVPGLELAILAPLSYRFSRLVWLYIDYYVTPK